ncbi:hypothetical protein FLONG3_8700 [Fusarium longipes]|uniref:Uncharacterized protein n=1 Tax=Fusarium longipes TaxID=694270 RepID=A0A395S480_9HYPO|nr:hypothetical protein FLONG3_8700 [Fusarium longipes]
MDIGASRSAEKLVLLVAQKRRKRAETEYAANSCRLKRHCSNQHLNSGARACAPLVHSDESVYQQDTSSSESSPENGQRLLLLHPSPDNVASGGNTHVHHTDDGNGVDAGDVQGSGSLAQRSPVHSDHSPVSTLQQTQHCQQHLGFRHAVRSHGQKDQGKYPSPPKEDFEGEYPSDQDAEVLETRESKSRFDSVVGHQGRGVGKPLGSLLPTEKKKGSLSHEEVAAAAAAQVQEGPSLNFDPVPVGPGPDFTPTRDISSLKHRRFPIRSCCSIDQDSQDEDSDDDASAPDVKFGNLVIDDAFEGHHGSCQSTIANRPARPYPPVVFRDGSSDERPEDNDSDDDNDNGELKRVSQVGSDESAIEAVGGQDHAEANVIEGSPKEATEPETLSQLFGATILGESDSEGYASDYHANDASCPPHPQQSLISSPGYSSHSDSDTLDQESSSESDSFYEDSDYEADDKDQSDETDEEIEYLSDLPEFDDEAPELNAVNALTPPTTTSGRRRLTSEERELVRQTREVGACCFPDPNNPEGKCKTCKRFSKTSPKTIHRVPCLRLRITEIVLYRSGGLNLTRRWKGVEMRDISERVPSSLIKIEVSQDFCIKPMFMEVVQFIPKAGDVTARYWTECHSGKATLKKKELATYCLKSIYDTAESVRRYTVENAIPAFLHSIPRELTSGRDGGPIFRTYYVAVKRYVTLNKEKRSGNAMSKEDEKEMEIFGNLFVLWCAIQHTVGSLYIEGDETLGMLPEIDDKSYPLYGKISAPRMIVAQFDCLVYNGVLEIYKERLLRDVDWLFSQDKNRWWFTIYLVLFILLREVSRMTADRYRHARDNFGPKLRYSIPSFVESLQTSCNNILTHWHYFNCNKWPGSKDENNSEHFENIAPEDLDLVMQTRKDKDIKNLLSVWKQLKANNGKVDGLVLEKGPENIGYTGSQDKFDWDHPLYWVAQMFEKNWYPHPTYQREPVPKNPFPTPISTPS